jgi:hypothetical protein
MPAFHPELVITLLFRSSSISCEIVSGATPIAHSIPQCLASSTKDGYYVQTKSLPFDLSKVKDSSVEIPFSREFAPFDDFSVFLELSKMAVSCITFTLDGVSYRHEVVCDKIEIDVRWYNPSEKQHPAQFKLISSYSKIVRQAGFEYTRWGGK